VTDVDTTASDVLEDLDEALNAHGISLVFAELKDPVRDKIERYGLTRTIDPRYFFPTLGSAVAAFRHGTGAEWIAADQATDDPAGPGQTAETSPPRDIPRITARQLALATTRRPSRMNDLMAVGVLPVGVAQRRLARHSAQQSARTLERSALDLPSGLPGRMGDLALHAHAWPGSGQAADLGRALVIQEDAAMHGPGHLPRMGCTAVPACGCRSSDECFKKAV
jgi:hypothetical protein